jgi:hypothetical protein
MDYHRRTLELFRPLGLLPDRARGATAVRIAAALGITLPPAVAEWYCVPEDSALWSAYCGHPGVHNTPILRRLRTLGDKLEAPQRVWLGCGVRDELSNDWWELPAVLTDRRGWLTEPVLPLMSEIYSSWWWGVVLDGTADPRVAITHDEGETWDFCGPSFSSYVFAILFDAALDHPAGFGRAVQIEAQVHGERRDRLRQEFRQEATTRDLPPGREAFFERYSGDGQRLRFVNANEHPSRSSYWRLWASSRDGFAEMVARLSRVFPAFTGLNPGKGRLLCVPEGSTAGDVDRPEEDAEIPF